MTSALVCFIMLAVAAAAQPTSVAVNFDPSTPSIGPFPTDYLTAPNPAQKTGLSVNLPMPDCMAQPSAWVPRAVDV